MTCHFFELAYLKTRPRLYVFRITSLSTIFPSKNEDKILRCEVSHTVEPDFLLQQLRCHQIQVKSPLLAYLYARGKNQTTQHATHNTQPITHHTAHNTPHNTPQHTHSIKPHIPIDCFNFLFQVDKVFPEEVLEFLAGYSLIAELLYESLHKLAEGSITADNFVLIVRKQRKKRDSQDSNRDRKDQVLPADTTTTGNHVHIALDR